MVARDFGSFLVHSASATSARDCISPCPPSHTSNASCNQSLIPIYAMSKGDQLVFNAVAWTDDSAILHLPQQVPSVATQATILDLNKPLPSLPPDSRSALSNAHQRASILARTIFCFKAPFKAGRCSSIVRKSSPITSPRPTRSGHDQTMDRGTQTSFEYVARPELVVQATTAHAMTQTAPVVLAAPNVPPRYYTMNQGHVRLPEAVIVHPARQQTRPRKTARARPQSLRSFLENADPASPSESEASDSTSVNTPIPAYTAPPLLNMNLIKPRGLAGEEEDPSSNTMGTYESRYSDEAPATQVQRVDGIAVTQKSILDRPLVSRRAISDSTAAENERQGIESASEPSTPVAPTRPPRPPSATPRLARARRRDSAPHLSPLRQEIKDESPPSPPPAPAKPAQTASTQTASTVTLAHSTKSRVPTLQVIETPMSEWGRRSPDIFRRPVEGYFEMPKSGGSVASAQTAVDVDAPPDHLQGSWLCPLHPRNRHEQDPFCPIHGHRSEKASPGVFGGNGGAETPLAEARVSMPQGNDPTPFTPGLSPSSKATSSSSMALEKERQKLIAAANVLAQTIARPVGRPSSNAAAQQALRDPSSPGGQIRADSQEKLSLSKFRLPGPDHSPGDPQCPVNSGRGLCVWHGRNSGRNTPTQSKPQGHEVAVDGTSSMYDWAVRGVTAASAIRA